MEMQWLKQLVELLESSSLTAMELEEDGRRVRLERNGKASAMPAPHLTQNTAAQAPQPEAEPAQQDWSGYKSILSPMVGTFHTLGKLGKGDDIAVGASVKKGQVICIIEAMKLMNEIAAEEDGEIVQALVKNGDMVEFGQLLFRYQ